MIRGIIPAVALPMNSKSEPNYDEYRKYLKWVMTAEVAGVAVNVDTGEGPTLTEAERVEVIKNSRSILGDKWLVAGIASGSTAAAVRYAKDAREAGADAGLVFPNSAFAGQPLDFEGPVEYHRRISEDADLDIVLFQLQPSLGGIDYGPEALVALAKLKHTVAIKEALFDAKKFLDTLNVFRSKVPRVSFLTGNDNFVYESFILGCDGALIGFGTLPIKDLVKMFELVQVGKAKEAGEIWNRLRPLMETIYGFPVRDYRARTKFALAKMGIISESTIHMRPPLTEVRQSEKDSITRSLKSAGLL